MACLDNPSVDTSLACEATGGDNTEIVDGRKRLVFVESLGLLRDLLVTVAEVNDSAATPDMLWQLEEQPVFK